MSSRLLSAVLPLCFLAAVAATAEEFDPTPVVLEASEFLRPDLQKGDHFETAERIENDGYMNSYRIRSDFGEFEAYGTLELALRVMEIGALAELDELSKTKVFADAAKSSALSSVDAIEQFAEQPVETVKGIPSGARRMFKVTRRRAGELVDKADEEISKRRENEAEKGDSAEGEGGEEGKSAGELADEAADAGSYLIKRYFGVTAAERRWAQKLGVDPYTSNEVLRKEIKEVARIDSAGKFGVKLLPIPSIPGASAIQAVNAVVWSKDPYELQDFNRERLLSMGVTEAQIEAFFEVPWLSPSGQTLFVSALAGLERAENRSLAIEQALDLESVDEGRFLLQAAQMLAWLNENEAPVTRLLSGERSLVALADGGRELTPVPVDHLSWTSELAELTERRTHELERAGVESRELWLIRGLSELCRERLEALGWRVETQLGEQMRESEAAGNSQAGR